MQTSYSLTRHVVSFVGVKRSMILSDYHVHSNYSSDCSIPMEEMAQQALRLGLTKLCFTDHMDIDYPQTSDGYSFVFRLEDYLDKLLDIKERYRSKLDILIGVELGLQPDIGEKLKTFVKQYPFDFIIGSSHVVDHMDPYYRAYWGEITEEEGIRKYFQSIIDNCNTFQDFHVYGHLDYIVRYTPSMTVYKDHMNTQLSDGANTATRGSMATLYPTYSYTKYADILDEVLKTLLTYQKGIEINTSGLKYGLGHTHPKTEVLVRYKELGGEIITIGSDAHKPEHLAYGFNQAAELLKSIGYRYYAIFVQGKPVMLPL